MPPPMPGGNEDDLSATRVYRQDMFRAQPPPPAETSDGGEVDEWAFSRRLVKEVMIFADVAASSASGYSRFRNVYRAALCWVAAGFVFILIGGELVSYIRNANLERDLSASAQEGSDKPRPPLR